MFLFQELYIRRKDGKTLLKDEAEKVIRSLEAAISRRVSEVQSSSCLLLSLRAILLLREHVLLLAAVADAGAVRYVQGFTLEVRGRDRVGLLSDVTRVLREHGLTVSRADVTTEGGQATNVFYVRDPSGQPVDMKTVEGLRGQFGQTAMLNVKKVSVPAAAVARAPEPRSSGGIVRNSFFSFGSLFAKLRA